MIIIVLTRGIATEQRALVAQTVKELFSGSRISCGESFISVENISNSSQSYLSRIEALQGVAKVEVPVYEACAHSIKGDNRQETSVRAGNLRIGRDTFTVIAGPCAIEKEDQYLELAQALKEAGAHMLRGAMFKPRTSPYSFQGIGLQGLEVIAQAKKRTQLPVVTEVTDVRYLDKVAQVADMIQVGTRNMRNYELLKELGRSRIPVMIKRGPLASLEEWLLSAEYVLNGGNDQVVLCERGDCAFGRANPALNFNIVLSALETTHLPVIVDPSHGTGIRSHVMPMSKAAAAVGAHGIMVEVHDNPETALVDGKQSLSVSEFGNLMQEIKTITA